MSPKIYYIIESGGVPTECTHIFEQALQRQKELSSKSREARIIPVTPVQLELPINDRFDLTDAEAETQPETRFDDEFLDSLALGDDFAG